MTTIVGINTPECVMVLAADRAVTCENVCNRGQSKILRYGRDAIAFAGECDRITKAVAYIEKHPRCYAQACKVARVSAVAVVGRYLLDLEWTGAMEEIPRYTALGSGKSVALGSLHSTFAAVKSARERALFALHAACEHDTNTAPPYDVLVVWPSRSKMFQYEH